RTANRESSVRLVMVPMASSVINISVRSTSAMIASVEPEATAAWIAAALPPRPAYVAEGAAASARKATAASLVPMFFMVVLRVPRWLVDAEAGVVFTGVEVHAHVGREDEGVELLGREIGLALVDQVRRGRERAGRLRRSREQLRRVQLLDDERAVGV